MRIDINNISPALLSYNAIPQNRIVANIPIRLRDLDDVNFTEPYTDGAVVMWDDANGTFILNTVASSIINLAPGNPGDTIRYGMLTGEGWLPTSNLFNDGVSIGINTVYPEDSLHVNGSVILEEYLRIRASSEPTVLDLNEIKLYVTSDIFRGMGYYNKVVKLCSKGENGEEVIYSSFLI